MALNTSTLLELIQNLAEENGDYLTFNTTTNIAADNNIVSTTLKQYDDGEDGYFDGWWVYLNTSNNASVERQTGLPGTTTYATASGTLTILGAALSAETAAQTCYLFRYKRDDYKKAIIEACKRIYPSLHKRIDDITLVTGNILPDGHLESWSSATALTYWTATNATLARTSTATYIRGGTYSAKVTASAANGNISVSSNDYPKLLQLQNKTINAYCMAYPQTADDTTMIIDTVSRDGSTTQTLTSTTSCPAGYWTMIEHENQTLNDDLQEVKLTLNVATNGQYAYFDDVYLGGVSLTEYLLPDDFIGAHLSQVMMQNVGTEDPMFYDAKPFITDDSGTPLNFGIINDGTYEYLKTEETSKKRRLRLIGFKPLETLSADTDTITIDSQRIPLLIAMAKMIFWKRNRVPVSVKDKRNVVDESIEAERDYRTLLAKHYMPRPIERR